MTVVKLDLPTQWPLFVTIHSLDFPQQQQNFFLVHLLKIRSVPGILIAAQGHGL